MDASLHDLIRRTKDVNTGKYRNNDVSHVLFIPQQQFITIKRDRLEEFWEDYCKLVYKGEGVYSIAEVNGRDMPVVSTMTLQFNKDNVGDLADEELFSDKFLIEVIYAWQQAVKAKLQVSDSNTELTCVVLESDKCWQENNVIYFQIYLHFPLCKTDSNSISKIRDKAISILRKRNATKELRVAPENDWDKIIDAQVHLEPLLLYKSVRIAGRPKITLTGVYGEIYEEHLEKEVAPIYELGQAFDPASHAYFSQGLISEDIFENQDNNPDKADPLFWLPLILSLNYSNSIVLPRDDEEKGKYKASENDTTGFEETATPFQRAQYFLQYLSQGRAVDPFLWRDVGRALYSSSEGTDDGLEAWINFTQQNDTFTREDCEINYRNFESEKQITYKTLAWFAKQDSPEEYKAWHTGWCQEALEKALQLHHAYVAEYIYRLYWLEIACADADKSIWYAFSGVRWCRKQKSVVLTEKINREIITNLESFRTEICKHVNTLTNKVEKQTHEIRIKAITELIAKLNDQRFVTQIIKAAITPFHIEYENFLDYADNNPNLMGHADCVTEADDKGIITRAGKPEDYITMTTGIHLKRTEFSWNHPLVKEVMDWLKKMHTDDKLRHEFLKECASWLRGRNIDKRVPIWTGYKNNAKSMIIRTLELAFSQYFGKFPTSMITGRRTQSSGASPEMARSKGRHVMTIQETDEDTETFKKGIIKELSGNDSIFCRGLYSEGGEFLPMFRLIIVCNKVPRFIGNDPAIIERVRIVPFLSTWCDDAPEDLEEQFKIKRFKKDPYFEVRLPLLAPALLWILVQYYPKYVEEGPKKVPLVEEYTKKYWEDQDIYAQYADDCLNIMWADEDETEPDLSSKLSHMELYRHFKGWINDCMPGVKPPSSKDAREGFNKIIPGFENKKWIGVKIVRDDEVLDI